MESSDQDLDSFASKRATFGSLLGQFSHSDEKEVQVSSGSSTPSRTLRSAIRKNGSLVVSPTLSRTTTSPSTRSVLSPSKSASPILKPKSKPRNERTKSRNRLPSPTASTPNNLRDFLAEDLDILFVGLNPGITTAMTGHPYAHPSNLFWKLLHWSGITPTLLPASSASSLPELLKLGNTNLVVRPSRDGSTLAKSELDEGVDVTEDKVRRFKPKVVCLVGKGIWDAVERVNVKKGRLDATTQKKKQGSSFEYGWKDEIRLGKSEDWDGARVFAATSTSGLAAGMKPPEKLAVWKILGDWVVQLREEREHRG